MSWRALLAILSIVFALTGLLGCGRKSSQAGDAAEPTDAASGFGWPSADVIPADRLEWNHRTLVRVYDEVGQRDPRWDAAARDALEAFARDRCRTDTNAYAEVKEAVERARKADCTDPLIRYLSLRFIHHDTDNANAAAADAYREVSRVPPATRERLELFLRYAPRVRELLRPEQYAAYDRYTREAEKHFERTIRIRNRTE